MNKIKKAVLPVAGLGTRFLPASKATPKEMLPIIDKPLVQYAVEEAIPIGKVGKSAEECTLRKFRQRGTATRAATTR